PKVAGFYSATRDRVMLPLRGLLLHRRVHLAEGEGFAVDASVMEANASRYHGKAPDELDWTEKQRQKRAVAEYLAALGAEAAIEDDASNESGGTESKRQRRYEGQAPKVISPSDPQSAWTAKVQQARAIRIWTELPHRMP
ncbi:MAG: hypothetical protein WBW81_10100, partial [Methylocella sp.]